jgi:hypothetical protein
MSIVSSSNISRPRGSHTKYATTPDFAGSQDFNANSIGGSRQTERLN